MSKISKEIKIGVAFIIAIAILYFGISFLKGVNIFKPANSYYVVFDDISGLTQSTPVTLNGLHIGLVYSMGLDSNNPKQVVAQLNLNKGLQIPKGSKVFLDVSMMGSATVMLEPNWESKEFIAINDTIMGERKSGLLEAGGEMMPQIQTLVPRIDSILVGLQAVTNNPALPQTMANVHEITSELAKSTKQLNQMLASVNKDITGITGNLSSASSDLAVTTAKIKEMDLESAYQSIDVTLKNIEHLSAKLNTKDNSVGLLLNDRQLYDSLNATLNNASLLLKDVRENPSRYINVRVF